MPDWALWLLVGIVVGVQFRSVGEPRKTFTIYDGERGWVLRWEKERHDAEED